MSTRSTRCFTRSSGRGCPRDFGESSRHATTCCGFWGQTNLSKHIWYLRTASIGFTAHFAFLMEQTRFHPSLFVVNHFLFFIVQPTPMIDSSNADCFSFLDLFHVHCWTQYTAFESIVSVSCSMRNSLSVKESSAVHAYCVLFVNHSVRFEL